VPPCTATLVALSVAPAAMSILTKLVLGAMGQLRPRPAFGGAAASIALPAAETRGGLPLMEELAKRRSAREFAPDALPSGAYRYDAAAHRLSLVATSDLRRVTGYQDFVDEAPLDLVSAADHARMGLVPVGQRASYASAAAGAIAQNVYLFAASSGLATVIRAWIDRAAMAGATGLTRDQQVLSSPTVGYSMAREAP